MILIQTKSSKKGKLKGYNHLNKDCWMMVTRHQLNWTSMTVLSRKSQTNKKEIRFQRMKKTLNNNQKENPYKMSHLNQRKKLKLNWITAWLHHPLRLTEVYKTRNNREKLTVVTKNKNKSLPLLDHHKRILLITMIIKRASKLKMNSVFTNVYIRIVGVPLLPRKRCMNIYKHVLMILRK